MEEVVRKTGDPSHRVFSVLKSSRLAHAIIFKNELHIHPDAAKEILKSKFKSLARKALGPEEFKKRFGKAARKVA